MGDLQEETITVSGERFQSVKVLIIWKVFSSRETMKEESERRYESVRRELESENVREYRTDLMQVSCAGVCVHCVAH